MMYQYGETNAVVHHTMSIFYTIGLHSASHYAYFMHDRFQGSNDNESALGMYNEPLKGRSAYHYVFLVCSYEVHSASHYVYFLFDRSS